MLAASRLEVRKDHKEINTTRLDTNTQINTTDSQENRGLAQFYARILVRHGQYDLDSDERGLTELGRRQSEKLAQRLALERQMTKKDRSLERNLTRKKTPEVK